MFASRSLVEHLARGIVGIGAVWIVLAVPCAEPAWLDALGRIVLGVLAFVSLRGCPMCWLVGLVETAMGRAPGCVDGRCSVRRSSVHGAR